MPISILPTFHGYQLYYSHTSLSLSRTDVKFRPTTVLYENEVKRKQLSARAFQEEQLNRYRNSLSVIVIKTNITSHNRCGY